jgi:hypothetical protein
MTTEKAVWNAIIRWIYFHIDNRRVKVSLFLASLIFLKNSFVPEFTLD